MSQESNPYFQRLAGGLADGGGADGRPPAWVFGQARGHGEDGCVALRRYRDRVGRGVRRRWPSGLVAKQRIDARALRALPARRWRQATTDDARAPDPAKCKDVLAGARSLWPGARTTAASAGKRAARASRSLDRRFGKGAAPAGRRRVVVDRTGIASPTGEQVSCRDDATITMSGPSRLTPRWMSQGNSVAMALRLRGGVEHCPSPRGQRTIAHLNAHRTGTPLIFGARARPRRRGVPLVLHSGIGKQVEPGRPQRLNDEKRDGTSPPAEDRRRTGPAMPPSRLMSVWRLSCLSGHV